MQDYDDLIQALDGLPTDPAKREALLVEVRRAIEWLDDNIMRVLMMGREEQAQKMKDQLGKLKILEMLLQQR